jgi:hypothetical protein
VTGSNEAALVVWYSALATLLIWVPVVGYLLLGPWAVSHLDRGLGWLTRRQRPVTVCALVVVALFLIGDAAALL